VGESYCDSKLEALYKRLVLRDVSVVKWSGQVMGGSLVQHSPTRQVRLSPPEAGYLLEPDRVTCRYDQRLALVADANEELVVIETAILVDFHFDENSSLEPEDEQEIEQRLLPDAYGIAYPFFREAFQTMSTRLGLGPIVLGILDPGEVGPGEVHVRGEAEFRKPT
jgi:hypothetical protein